MVMNYNKITKSNCNGINNSTSLFLLDNVVSS